MVLFTVASRLANVPQLCCYIRSGLFRWLLGETYALADIFYLAYVFRHDLSEMLERKLPPKILTNTEGVFTFIAGISSITSEKRLIVGIYASKQAGERWNISDVGGIRSKNNLTDALKNGVVQGVEGTFGHGDCVHAHRSTWISNPELEWPNLSYFIWRVGAVNFAIYRSNRLSSFYPPPNTVRERFRKLFNTLRREADGNMDVPPIYITKDVAT